MIANLKTQKLSDDSKVYSVLVKDDDNQIIEFNCITKDKAIDLIESFLKNTVDFEG